MALYLKNTKNFADTWDGQTIEAGVYYPIANKTEQARFTTNDKTVADIGSGDLLVATENDGTGDIVSGADGIAVLYDDKATHIANPFPDNVSKYSFRGVGGNVAATAGSNNVDILVAEKRIMNGAEMWTDDTAFGAYVNFQVVDKDNVLGFGAGVVLETFGTGWQLHRDHVTKTFPGYIAVVPAGVYIRLVTTVTNNCNVYYNLHLHKQ